MASTTVIALLVASALGSPRVVGENLDPAEVNEVQHAIDGVLAERETELGADALVSVRPGPDGAGFLYRVEVDGDAVVPPQLCSECTAAELAEAIVSALADADRLRAAAATEPSPTPPAATPRRREPDNAPPPRPRPATQRRVNRFAWSGSGVLLFGGTVGGLGGAALAYPDSSTPVRNLGIAGLAIGGAAAIAGFTLLGLAIAEASKHRKPGKRTSSRLRIHTAGVTIAF